MNITSDHTSSFDFNMLSTKVSIISIALWTLSYTTDELSVKIDTLSTEVKNLSVNINKLVESTERKYATG